MHFLMYPIGFRYSAILKHDLNTNTLLSTVHFCLFFPLKFPLSHILFMLSELGVGWCQIKISGQTYNCWYTHGDWTDLRSIVCFSVHSVNLYQTLTMSPLLC